MVVPVWRKGPPQEKAVGRRVDENVEKLGKFARGLPPSPGELGVARWAGTARSAATSWNLGVAQRLGKLSATRV